jgi:hypothetical protein
MTGLSAGSLAYVGCNGFTLARRTLIEWLMGILFSDEEPGKIAVRHDSHVVDRRHNIALHGHALPYQI